MKSKLNFFTLILLYLILFISLTKLIFKMTGWKFYIEIAILIGLLIFAFISLILMYNKINFGYTLSTLVSAIILINLILIFVKGDLTKLMFLTLISSITAFVVSVINIGEKKVKISKPMPKEKPVIKTYIPGKVISSKTSSYYHVPKCDQAKKIKKRNSVWFDNEEDAKKEGLKAHNCAK